MPRQFALFIYIVFILWLFVRDLKLRPMTSGQLWVALLWIVLIGTKPVSVWLGAGTMMETPDDYIEGSPLDRNVLTTVLVAELLILLKRRIDCGRLFRSNPWVLAFFIYGGISIIWSDFPLVSLKRWMKDLGNLFAAAIILTENVPSRAVRAVLSRYLYIVIPLSVLLVKYFPDLGRYYNLWTWEPVYCGVTTNKNELGGAMFLCALFLIWDFIQLRGAGSGRINKADMLNRIILLSMTFWLMREANSSTAVVCMILGIGILLLAQFPFARRQAIYLGTYSLVIGLSLILLYSIPGVFETIVEILGRNITLTGRTDLWDALMREADHPILGTGFKSFWLGPVAERMWEKFSFHPIQAHNGYLETYLNGGLVGIGLLTGMIVSTGSRLKRELQKGNSFGVFLFTILIVTIFYNYTEALFNQLSLVWVLFLIAALRYQPSHEPLPEQ
jgi:exopolysaccharide production protein ExoQ